MSEIRGRRMRSGSVERRCRAREGGTFEKGKVWTLLIGARLVDRDWVSDATVMLEGGGARREESVETAGAVDCVAKD